MTGLGFAVRSFLHYLRFNLTVAIGIAISTAILTGGLIVGDSVRYSLEQSTKYRLGETQYGHYHGRQVYNSLSGCPPPGRTLRTSGSGTRDYLCSNLATTRDSNC